METINDRIEVIVNELFDGNKAAFAKAIGLAPTAISSYLGKQRRSRPSVDMVINIVKVTGVSYSWLLTGEGAMMQQADGITHGGDPPSPPPASITYYPSVSGAAGDIPFTEDNELEHLAMQVPTFEDCRLAVNVYGNSMAPGIKSGDIVLMAEWRERYIEWGNIYLVVTRSGHRVIKRLYQSDDEQCIECRSDNAEASPPFKVDKGDILHLYLVKGHISRDAM